MTSLSPLPRRNSLAFLIATWFGCGFAPVAPGTAGSLAGLLIAIGLHYYAVYYAGYGRTALLALTAILLAPAIWAAGVVAKQTNQADPQIVVVDEVIGQWITLAGAATFNWKTWLAALALFRFLDVWKPAPARQLERLPGGWGIVADDVMAGLYGALAIFVLDRLHLFSYGF
jgi:phosphatidylglycerophosphatase A